MVKRSRDQSQEAPSRFSWLRIMPPDSAFHSQTLSMNSSRPSVAAVDLALHQLALDHHLGGDAGVVHARLPQHVLAAHALEADENVLQRVVERVAHMQRAGDVGRRNDDGERLGTVGGAGAGAEMRPPRPRAWRSSARRLWHRRSFKHSKRSVISRDCSAL